MQTPYLNKNYTPSNGSSSTTTSYVNSCVHEGTTPVWTEVDDEGNKREFVLADIVGCKHVDCDVALDLNNNLPKVPVVPKPTVIITDGPEEFRALNELVQKETEKVAVIGQVVKFDWKDYQAVEAPLVFWQRLTDLFPKNGRVMITCHGSHGRSGTAMAAILIAKGMTSGQAMEYVRLMHCSKAVESSAQEDYLRELYAEAVMAEINRDAVQDAIAEVTRTDGKYEYCTVCGRGYAKKVEDTDVCSDCHKDGFREGGTLPKDAHGRYIPPMLFPLPKTSNYKYGNNFPGYYDGK